MAKLNLNTLQCHDTTSGPGSDDVYIQVDGGNIYPDGAYGHYHNFDAGDSAELKKSVSFTDKAKVVVKDYDSTSPDDLIGSFWVSVSQVGDGELAESMNGDGSDYDLYYEVTN
ncbi:hypothetical protein [Streptomyces sp. NPDC003697]